MPPVKDGFPALAPEIDTANTGFDRSEFTRLAQVEADSFWFRSRNKLIIWALRKYFPSSQSFLEVGCGTGFVLSGISAACPALKLHGSELSVDGLGFASERLPGVPLMQMNALDVPFRNEFDIVGLFDVLEHIENDEEVLMQLHKATKPGGGLLLTVPQHGFLWSERDKLAGHFRRYSRKELCEKLKKAGFRLERTTSFVSVLLPLLFASRMLNTDDSNEKAAQSLTPNAVINSLLGLALDLERQAIKLGIPMYLGGSLLAVARRSAEPQ